MSVPGQKTVIIVDPMAFRRARVESFLERWAKDQNVKFISLPPEEAHTKLIESNCDMLIYNVGGASPSACDTLAEIEVLRALRPAAPLVTLSDDMSQGSMVAVMNSGAHGYLNNSMTPDLALQALSFILHGGTYFPIAAIRAGQTMSDTPAAAFPRLNDAQDISPGQSPRSPRDQDQASIAPHERGFFQRRDSLFGEEAACVQPSDHFAGIQTACADLNVPQLTERQQVILCCLSRGDSNKSIARTCHIAESTVKIHLKSILRKIHVKNRTQAAIWALQNGMCKASDRSGSVATDELSDSSPSLFLSEDQV